MVRFSQNYGVQIVEGLLDYFKKKKSESRQQGVTWLFQERVG